MLDNISLSAKKDINDPKQAFLQFKTVFSNATTKPICNIKSTSFKPQKEENGTVLIIETRQLISQNIF